MQGSLALHSGVLYVGRHEQTAHVRPYDLDGRPLGDGFSFRGPGGEPSAIRGLAVDRDHHLWVADSQVSRVRAFSLFGREVGGFGGASESRADGRGVLRALSDVALSGEGEEALLTVACGGWRRHAVQVFRPDGAWVGSLRPEGNPLGRFNGVRRVAVLGEWTYVCETRSGRVQVFKDGEFHYAFSVPASGGRAEPAALAPLADGRAVLACGGAHSALLLVDAAGRLLRVLAEWGHGPGQVFEPNDVAVEEGAQDGSARLAVVDCDAERVQVFTLEGRCFGALDQLPGQVAP